MTNKLNVLIVEDDENDSAALEAGLVPQTEGLLASYCRMTNQERNQLLKEILQKIEYRKEPGGPVEIDLYPRLPRLLAGQGKDHAGIIH